MVFSCGDSLIDANLYNVHSGESYDYNTALVSKNRLFGYSKLLRHLLLSSLSIVKYPSRSLTIQLIGFTIFRIIAREARKRNKIERVKEVIYHFIIHVLIIMQLCKELNDKGIFMMSFRKCTFLSLLME